MAMYLYEVFIRGEREPRLIQARNLKEAQQQATERFEAVEKVRLAREWFNQ